MSKLTPTISKIISETLQLYEKFSGLVKKNFILKVF